MNVVALCRVVTSRDLVDKIIITKRKQNKAREVLYIANLFEASLIPQAQSSNLSGDNLQYKVFTCSS